MRVKDIQIAMKTKSGMVDWLLLTSPAAIRYISGFTGSDGALLISRDAQYLLVDGRYTTQAVQQAPDFEVVECKNGILEQISEFSINCLGYEAKHMSVKKYEQIKEIVPGIVLVDLSHLVDEMRECKEAAEIDLLKKAAKIADQTFAHIIKYIQPGMSERQIALEIEYNMRRQGATGTSFDTIVASGPRTAMPHARPTGKRLEYGDFVLLDYGCIYNGYCSDMTRTIVIGQPSDKQREIYDIVMHAQKRALNEIKSGITARDADAIARRVIQDAGYGANFSHSLGHGVGLDVHEKPVVSAKSEKLLKSGMVISVEPGIYLPDEFGVRIEDVVLIKADGVENFTASTKDLVSISGMI